MCVTRKIIISLFCALALFCSATVVSAGDSTSFDPLKVDVKAKGAGGVPVGTVVAWPVATNPPDMENWLECNGQGIDQTAYPELAAIVGATVPDYRGLFLRGHGSQIYSQNNGSTVGVTATVHSSAGLGIVQGDAIRKIEGGIGAESGVNGLSDVFSGRRAYVNQTFEPIWHYQAYFDSSRVTSTANEFRPANISVRYLMRALP
jgi:hypothetical protein